MGARLLPLMFRLNSHLTRPDNLETVFVGDGQQLLHIRRLMSARRDLRHFLQGFLETARRYDDDGLSRFCTRVGKLVGKGANGNVLAAARSARSPI